MMDRNETMVFAFRWDGEREGQLGSGLEGNFGGVHRVVASVIEHGLQRRAAGGAEHAHG